MKKIGLYAVSLIIIIGVCAFLTSRVQAQNEPMTGSSAHGSMKKKAPEAKTTAPAKAPAPKPVAESSSNKYVGADKCAACHPVEYSDFQKRKFQKSWKILKMRGEEDNPECLECHSTGHGRGGFVSENETPHLTGKQCEACHGPGGNHVSNPTDAGFKKQLKVDDKEHNVCIECHACMTTHRSADF